MNQILTNYEKSQPNNKRQQNNKQPQHRGNYRQPNFNKNRNMNFSPNGNKANIKIITRVFAIILIVFGLAIIGQSVMALTSSDNRPKDHPIVSTDKAGKEVTINVQTAKPIKQFEYKWNDGEETVVQGNETQFVSHTIDIPNGNNILKITVEDFYGNKTYYYKQYIYESTDVSKPTIDIAITGTKLKITASDDTKLSYLSYKWNDDEEKKIEAEENQTEITEEIEVAKGQNKLTIIAVDGEENKTTRTENIIGDTKPEVYVSTEGSNIVITAKDDEGITKISVTVDGQTTDSGESPLNQTEVSATVPVSQGTHTVSATATNVNGLKATKEITADI